MGDRVDGYEFFGEHEHSVDDKGRVIMPLDFRAGLGEEFVVTRAPERGIFVLPMPIWKQLQKGLSTGALLGQEKDFLLRMMGGRTIVKLDPQSRLSIPKHLRDWAKINQSQSVSIIGQGSRIEIWSKPVWEDYCDRFTDVNFYNAARPIGIAETVGR